mmetsp:Transcript_10189/g.14825  ORF Transcript_10189/g.14825 Transcript_10189/m.14825 type:complete len:369 (+) Transcript_10189:49-1155(+)
MYLWGIGPMLRKMMRTNLPSPSNKPKEAGGYERYQQKSLLCESLFGTIKLATDTSTGSEVVLKSSSKCRLARLGNSPSTREDPRREIAVHRSMCSAQQTGISMTTGRQARSGKRSSIFSRRSNLFNRKTAPTHPNICKILDSGENEEYIWAVLEYCPRGDLLAYVQSVERLSLKSTLQYMHGITSALCHIHNQGGCHLDLSPENLFLSANGQIKLADFGQANLQAAVEIADSHVRMGKSFYRAPEIFLAQTGEIVDGQKADLFSLGIILHVMLAGHPPFASAAPSDKRFAFFKKHGSRKFLEKTNVIQYFSEEAADLLEGLLAPAETRLTIEQVRTHPYLAELAGQPHRASPNLDKKKPFEKTTKIAP